MAAPHQSIGWYQETEALRGIVLSCGLDEEQKWGKPCFTFEGRNVVIIIGLKEACALSFFKGALLKDRDGILARPGEHTQSGRWIKFKRVTEILRIKKNLKAYIQEAIEVEKARLQVPLKTTTDYKVPAELEERFKTVPHLKQAFYCLTPGRQRAYLLHFAAPKLSRTREARIDKFVPLILKGKGPNDDYLATRKKKSW